MRYPIKVLFWDVMDFLAFCAAAWILFLAQQLGYFRL